MESTQKIRLRGTTVIECAAHGDGIYVTTGGNEAFISAALLDSVVEYIRAADRHEASWRNTINVILADLRRILG